MEWPTPQYPGPQGRRTRFVENEGDRAIVINRYPTPHRSSHGHRNKSSSNRKHRRHATYEQDSDEDRISLQYRSEDSDFDPTFFDQGHKLPSLTFHFNFDKAKPEGVKQKPVVPGSKHGPRHEGNDSRHKSYHENVYNVVSSRYNDGLHSRGDSTVELVTRHGQESPVGSPQELLKWMYECPIQINAALMKIISQIERQYPDFDSFLEYVSHLDCLEDEAKQAAASLINNVRALHEKPLQMPQGKKGKYLDPNVTEAENLDKEEPSDPKTRRALLLCMPYFCLAPYSAYSPSQSSNFYPMRTLLQSWHMSTPESRDLQQAICSLDHPRKDYVFHVPQVWCLILGNNLLISCTHSPAVEVKRGLSGIKVLPASAVENSQPQLRLSDGGSRIWLLPVKDCTTWLEFVAKFWELDIDFENRYEVLFAGDPQDAGSWPSLIERAQRMTVELKVISKRYQEHPLGWDEEVLSGSDYSTVSKKSSVSDGVSRSDSSQKTPSRTPTHASSSPGTSAGKGSGRKQKPGTLNVPSSSRSEPSSPATPDVTIPKGDSAFPDSFEENHILMWFAAISSPEVPKGPSGDGSHGKHTVNTDQDAKNSYGVDNEKIEGMLADMHSYLCTSRFKKSREYRKCPVSTIDEVNAILAQFAEDIKKTKPKIRKKSSKREPEGYEEEIIIERETRRPQRDGHRSSRDVDDGDDDNGPESTRRLRSSSSSDSDDSRVRLIVHQYTTRRKRNFIRIAKTLFDMFLPLKYRSEMVSKYWGAVHSILQDESKVTKCFESLDKRLGFPKYTPRKARDIWHSKQTINDLSQGRAPPPYKIAFPESLREAWPHLVMFFVLSTVKQSRQAFQELVKFRDLAFGSRKDLLKSLSRQSLHRREAVLPLGIMTLVIKNLLGDVTLGSPDIISTYREYLDKLNQKLLSNPYSRVHQEKISRLREEVGCVTSVLRDQLDCVEKLQDGVGQDSIDARAFQREREFYILRDCTSSIESRIRQFREMGEEAAQLASWNIGRIESNKDRHEAAILVFTTVTVVFLPLSFVSSVFGMNTADIRNMDQHQWIFWATALPVTILVIGISLFVIRYFETARQALGQFLLRGSSETRGGFGLPTPQLGNQAYERVQLPSHTAPPPVIVQPPRPSQYYSQPVYNPQALSPAPPPYFPIAGPSPHRQADDYYEIDAPRHRSHHVRPRAGGDYLYE